MNNTQDFGTTTHSNLNGLGRQKVAWKPLRFLNTYRLVLASLFLTLIVFGRETNILGQANPTLFFTVSVLYLAVGGLSFFTIRWKRPPFIFQVFFQAISDMVAIVLLMHASGGLHSGLGILLIVAIAGGSLLLARKSAVLLAAIATLLLLLEQVYIVIYDIPLEESFTHAGLLGAIMFSTAAMAQFLARRVRETEALAAQRGIDLANMEQLAEYIIQRMQTGIVVVDVDRRIRLINESAWHLLGMPFSPNERTLEQLSSSLNVQIGDWLAGVGHAPQVIRVPSNSAQVMPRFARLGQDETAGTLIFLEDTSAVNQQAQQLKLASLGRLTASIAHEIRNPLGAISHAGQLLAESSNLDAGETRMTQIIKDNTSRMNTIVENVLQLSRRQAAKPEEFGLTEWLSQFVDEFSQTCELKPSDIKIEVIPEKLVVRFDPSQLHQIVWNLCQNALRYTVRRNDGVTLLLRGGIKEDPPTPHLEIIDFGSGISDTIADDIFEPFFTTEPKGTGLGLYIARELCETNNARLSYHRIPGCESSFRITFADVRRTKTIM